MLGIRLLRTCPLAVAALVAATALPNASAQSGVRPLLIAAAEAPGEGCDLWALSGNPVEAANLTASEPREYDAALSPDGSRIAYTAALEARESRTHLWLMNADGTRRRQLTRTGQYVFAPSWSPDGKRIAFTTLNQPLAGAPEFGLRFVETDGSGQGSLGTGLWPQWSPDGTQLLFTRLDPANGWQPDLTLARADGSEPKSLGPKQGMMGAWSPDGKRIAYVAEGGDRQPDLFVMEADGSRRTRLTRTAEFEMGPQWSADGRRLLFTRLPKEQPALARIWSLDPEDRKAMAVQVTRRDRMEILGGAAFWLLGGPGSSGGMAGGSR